MVEVQDESDRTVLLSMLEDGMQRFNAQVAAYCLMSNHYHFVLQKLSANVARLMRHVNGVVSQVFNHRHRKVGHLFQGRFKATLVVRDADLLELCRTVDLTIRCAREW